MTNCLIQLRISISLKTREILGLTPATIEAGLKAELTVFAPNIAWEYNADDVKSKSKNSPLLGTELKGLPVGVINNGQLFLNS